MPDPKLLKGVPYCNDCHETGRPRHDYAGPLVDGFCPCPVGIYVRNRLEQVGALNVAEKPESPRPSADDDRSRDRMP